MIRALLDRRVPQLVGVYIAGGWGFVQFVDWAADEYALSPSLTTLAAVLLLLLLPTVAIIAWRHGAPGPSEWKRIDAVVAGTNVVVAAAVLFAAFPDFELRPTTEVKLLEDSRGDTVSRSVPLASEVKVVQLFDLDNRTGDPTYDWLEHGLRFAVDQDLIQEMFVGAASPEFPTVRERLAEAGIGPYDDIPLTLMRDIAHRQGTDFFFDGTIERAPDDSGVVVRTQLYSTSTGNEVATRTYELNDPLEVADRISRDLREYMGLPAEHLAESPDLPVRELTSESIEAFRRIAEARVTDLREGDQVEALRLIDEAIERDSTAALAYFARGNIMRRAGDQAGFAEANAALSRYAYRLPERLRLQHQAWSSLAVDGDIDAAVRAASYWTEVYPGDAQAHHTLAEIHEASGDFEAELRARRAVLGIEPDALWAMDELADTFGDAGQTDSALVYYRRLRDAHPDQPDLRASIANLLIDEGRFDEAREELANARAASPDDPDFRRFGAIGELLVGNLEAAEALMQRQSARPLTPIERERWAGFRETYYYVQGQFSGLEAAYRERLELLSDFHTPTGLVGLIDNSEFLLYADEAGRSPEALAEIARLQAMVESPHNLDLEWPAARLHLAAGDLEAAHASLRGLEQLGARDGNYPFRRAQRAWLRGRIAQLEDGDCHRALPDYQEAVRITPRYAQIRPALLACYGLLERWDEAEEQAEWMLQRRPGYPTMRLAIARYYEARGRTEDALSHLDAALDTWSAAEPDYRPAIEAREMRARLAGG